MDEKKIMKIIQNTHAKNEYKDYHIIIVFQYELKKAFKKAFALKKLETL